MMQRSAHHRSESNRLPHRWQIWSSKILRPRRLPLSSQVVPSLFVALDSFAILLAALVAYAAIVGSLTSITGFYTVAFCFVWLTGLMLMNFAGLYEFEALMRPLIYVDRIIIAFVATFLFLLAAAFSLKISATFSRIWIATFAVSSCSVVVGFRVLASFILSRLSRRPSFKRKVVVAGRGEQLVRLLDYMARYQPPFVSLVGVFVDDEADLANSGRPYEVLGRLHDVTAYARSNAVDDVVIALPWSADDLLVTLVNRLRELALNVYLGSDLVGMRLKFRPAPGHFGEAPVFFEVTGSPFSGWNAMIKGAEDYILGALASVLLMPLMLVIAIAIKIESRGPVLFRQKRLGLLNQEFSIYKFRTMKHQPLAAERTIQASRNDPRVTPLGRLLRRTSLDELPNIINVLTGTMSLVGPRPHAVDHNQTFSEIVGGYFVRHRVKPGITGWAQVNGFRGPTDTLEKMEGRVKCDVYYAENWSFWFDVQILLMTVVVCLTGRNAY
jgi:putative colanic acid biosysnthesis UDP-glucose lipid carrier transferase